MNKSKRFFSLIVIASMLLWEINPVLPALAQQPDARDTVVTDWSTVDWNSEVLLASDQEQYRKDLEKLLRDGKSEEAKNLKPIKRRLSSEEAMEYFSVPENIKEMARENRDIAGVFAQKKDKKSEGLEENFIDVSNAEKLNVKKLIPIEQGKNQPTVKIKSVKDNVADHALRNVTIDGLGRKARKMGLPVKKKLLSYLTDLFKAHEVYADEVVPLIEYYDGIENNILDNALYYISKSQTDDGSFGQVANYEETAEAALMLSEIKRTDNTQFNDALNYLINTEPQNNREKAIKARLMVGLGKPYLNYLDELVSVKNMDHGYGLDAGMKSDMLTTMEAALAMYAADYSIQDELPLALFYVLNRIPENGALRYTEDGPVSYYLINKIAQELKPFKDMTVGNGQINIVVQNKIDALLGYLSSQFDSDSEKILGTNDIIDQIMTLETWQYYGVEMEKQAILEKTIKGGQYINGGFDNSVRATTHALKVLKQPDLVLTDVQSVGVLESKKTASFDLTIKNQGYAKADSGIVYVFPDNFNGGLTLNLKSNGIVIQPNQTITLNIAISDTNSYTGVMDMKFYAEVAGDYNHENNWIYKNFTFASAANGAPALPMYFIAQKYENGGAAGLNVHWPKKTDPNRLNYVVMWREKGIAEWNFQGISNTWNGAFLTGGFEEGATYEVTAGVLHKDGETVTYFVNFNDVVVSGDKDKYLGGAAGYATNNNEKLPNVYTWAFGGGKKTDADGNFANSGIENGSNAAWVDVDYYESIVTKFLVPVNATTTAVRLFSRLMPDNQAPVMTGFELKGANTFKVKSQTEYNLFAWGSDNLALKEADFFLWNPSEEIWTYLGTQGMMNTTQALMPWYVPADLLGAGYKVKAIFSDYHGNKSNAVEWGPFEIISGAPPTVNIISPNGGEQWQLGSTQEVKWAASSPYGVSKISLYSDYDGQVDTINSNLQNTGSYQWNIPLNSNYAGTKIKLKVKGQDAQTFYTAEDFSDEYFSVVDSSPDPAKPWSRPKLVSDFDSHTVSNCNLSNPLLDYDENGVLHIFYYCISDVYGNPRIMTEQIYHVTKNNDILSAPAVVYEKVSEIYNDDYSNYRPIDANSLVLKMVSDNIYIFWQDTGWGGCETFNQDELYYIYFDGQKWSEIKNLSNNNTAMRDLDVAVSKTGDLHVTWMDGLIYDDQCDYVGSYVAKYLKKVGSQWSVIESIEFGENIYEPNIVVADDSKLHMVYETTNQVIRHVYKTGSWSVPVTVFTGGGGGGINTPVLVGGLDGQLHYSFGHYYTDPINGNGYRIMYVNYSGNQWLSAEEVYPVEKNKSPEYPKLTVGENNKPQLLVEYYNSENNTRHPLWKTKNFLGNWTNPVAIDLVSQYVDNSSNELVYHNGEVSAVWIAAYSKKWNVFLNHADLVKFNTPPVAENVIINKLPVSNNLEAGYSLSDVDGQNVTPIIDWRVNDYSLAILNMPFEANTNTEKVKDYSVLKNDAVVYGAVYNASAGYNGGGTYYFDGSDYIALDNKNLNYDKLSISMWVKTDAKKQQGIMSDYANSSYYSSRLYMEADGRLSFEIGSHIDKWKHTISSIKTINDNNWHYITATYDREKMKIYVDGALDGQGVETKKIGIGLSWKPFIGTNTYNASTVLTAWVSNAFTGFIDDVALYDSALTSQQISIMYNNGIGNDKIIDVSEFYLTGPWSVCVTPNDGKEDGQMVCSEKVFPNNQAPTQDNPLLQQQPEKSLLLTPQNLNDADGDHVSSIVNWKVNNSPILALNTPFEGRVDNNIIKDYSGYNNIGNVFGAMWNKNGGHDGFGAYEFDGVDDYAKFSNNLDNLIATSSVSVSFWIKTTDKSGIVFGNSTGNYTPGFKYQLFGGWGGTSVVWFKDGSPNCNDYFSYSTKDVTDGLWHHVVAVLNREDGTIRMYVDGQHVSNPVRKVPNMGSMVSNSDLKISVNSPGDFKGSIDDLQVFNRALSFEQIKTINSGKKFEIVNEETEFGETWQACITPNDGKVDGQTKCSDNVALVQSNQAPTQDVPLIEKTPENNLLAIPQAVNDANGDNVSTIIDWRLNDQSLLMLNMPFDGGKLAQNNTMVKDYSLNGNNGVVTGATYNSTGGRNNTGAFYFSGAPQEYIKIPGLHATDNKYTVSVWIKPAAHINRELFFNFGGSTGMQYADLKPDNSVLYIHGANTPFTRITTKNKLVTGQWNHMVITWDGTKMLAYVNGQLDGAIQSGTVPVAMNNDTYIGSFFGSLPFIGFIDDVSIYGRSISPEQASLLFANELNTIASQETKVGEGWQACVTPNDGKVDGAEKCSEIKIIN